MKEAHGLYGREAGAVRQQSRRKVGGHHEPEWARHGGGPRRRGIGRSSVHASVVAQQGAGRDGKTEAAVLAGVSDGVYDVTDEGEEDAGEDGAGEEVEDDAASCQSLRELRRG